MIECTKENVEAGDSWVGPYIVIDACQYRVQNPRVVAMVGENVHLQLLLEHLIQDVKVNIDINLSSITRPVTGGKSRNVRVV
jgi:hypothetical protein